MDLTRDLELEMNADAIVIAYCEDREIATDFYRALCNVCWRPFIIGTDEDRVIGKLRGENAESWSCSWRHAGGLVAQIRNSNYNCPDGISEDYMDFYCSGGEGWITPLVKECFKRMGWEPVP